jgi:hypothetical protein
VNPRIVWPVVALLGLVFLAIGISTVLAQWPPQQNFFGVQPGRYSVAHATAKEIVILDTGTGKLYKATESDFLKYSELRKDKPAPRQPPPDKDKLGGPPPPPPPPKEK